MFYRLSLILLFFLSSAFSVTATHLRFGQILVEQMGKGNKTVKVTVYYFTNGLGTNVLFGGDQDVLDFGDGTFMVIPEQQNNDTNDKGIILPDGVKYATYTITHAYESYGRFTVTYREPNRNEGILNLDNSVNTPAYLETSFILEYNTTYRTPEPLMFSFVQSNLNSDLSESAACVNYNPYLLRYELTVPLSDRNTPVMNYQALDNFSINPNTGLMRWNNLFKGTKTLGEYLIAIKTIEYDTTGGRYREVGYTYRDVQIITKDLFGAGRLDDNRELDEDNRIFVDEAESYQVKLFAFHGNDETVTYQMASQLGNANVSITEYDSISPNGPVKVGILTLTSSQAIQRNMPYPVVVRSIFQNGYQYSKDLVYSFFTRDVQFLPHQPDLVSVDPKELNSIVVYPNPVNDFLVIKNIKADRVIVSLYSSTGQLIPAKLCQDNSIDFSHLPSGMYYLKVQDKGSKQISVVKLKH